MNQETTDSKRLTELTVAEFEQVLTRALCAAADYAHGLPPKVYETKLTGSMPPELISGVLGLHSVTY